MMKRILVLLVLVPTTSLFGQDKPEQKPVKTTQTKTVSSKNPVTDAVREILSRQQKNLVAAVDEMPADKFSYSPTPAQMSFGRLVLHVAMSNVELCSKAGSMPPPPMRFAPETDKVRLQAALAKSFLYCDAALNRLNDATLGHSIELDGKQVTVASTLISLTNDWADHYSAAAVYLRLNGLLPPTAQPQK
jgi:DinB family protein